MEKLLHERLEEIIDGGRFRFENGCDIYIPNCEAEALLEEIKKYYTPLPRFEDGEPIELGKPCNDIKWSDGRIGKYIPNGIDNQGRLLAIGGGNIYAVTKMTDDGFVSRNQPKVYDADGVEIKVGDTVWTVIHSPGAAKGRKFTVDEIDDDDTFFDESKHVWVNCSDVSHKEPDSLERIKADRELSLDEFIEKYPAYYRDKRTKVEMLLDRAIAIIESGA